MTDGAGWRARAGVVVSESCRLAAKTGWTKLSANTLRLVAGLRWSFSASVSDGPVRCSALPSSALPVQLHLMGRGPEWRDRGGGCWRRVRE